MAPALQCVSTTPGGRSPAPSLPMARQAATSSVWIAMASRSSAAASTALSPARRPIRPMRSSAQNRFTAVGRVRRSAARAEDLGRGGPAAPDELLVRRPRERPAAHRLDRGRIGEDGEAALLHELRRRGAGRRLAELGEEALGHLAADGPLVDEPEE